MTNEMNRGENHHQPRRLERLKQSVRHSAAAWNLPSEWAWTIFLMPLVGSVFFLLLRLEKSWYRAFLTEDGPIEWLQFVCYAVAAVVAACASRHLLRRRLKLQGLLFAAFAMGAFFVAGEEISWGQRVFNLKTPHRLKAVNHQKELNVHNIGPVLHVFRFGMFCIAVYGSTAVFLRRRLPLEYFGPDAQFYMVPPLVLVPSFATMAVYRFVRATIVTESGFTVTAYAEWCETCLGFALMCFATLAYRRCLATESVAVPATATLTLATNPVPIDRT